MNQNPEQLARDQIDTALMRCGWLVLDNSKIKPETALSPSFRKSFFFLFRPRLGEVEDVEIPVYLLGTERHVVQFVESRFKVTGKMEEGINQSLQQAEALRQSILKNAFEGKLI